MSDIIEAAARALKDELEGATPIEDYYTFGIPDDEARRLASAVLAAVTPLIRAAALEEAASMVEQSTLVDYSLLKYFAADIRALKGQP
jgi:hypothetical protein